MTIVNQVNQSSSNSTYIQGYTQNNTSSLLVPVDTEGRLSTNFPKTAFGQMSVAERTPVVQVSFQYVLNTELVTTSNLGTGTVTQSNNFCVLSTGAASNASGVMYSRRFLKYRAGQGAEGMYTAVFGAGKVGNQQIAGVGNTENGFFFGYNGSNFGICMRSGSTDTWTSQTAWNYDVMDGTGFSGMTLNPLLGNVYRIQFQWLGFGAINFFIEETNSGSFTLVHRIKYANTNANTTISYASFPVYFSNKNTTNTTAVVLKTPCISAFIEGQKIFLGPKFSLDNYKTLYEGITVGTNYSILGLQNKATYQTKTNLIPIFFRMVSSTSDTTTVCYIITMIRGGTVGGTPSYTDVNTTNSVVSYDTAGTTVTGGVEIFSFAVTSTSAYYSSTTSQDLVPLDLFLSPGETLNICVKYLTAPGNNPDTLVCISWVEDV